MFGQIATFLCMLLAVILSLLPAALFLIISSFRMARELRLKWRTMWEDQQRQTQEK